MQQQVEQAPKRPGFFRRFFRAIGRGLEAGRRTALNLITLVFLILFITALIGLFPASLKDKTALVINLQGPLVEEESATDVSLVTVASNSELPQQIQLRDFVTVLDTAAKDPKIERVLLLLDDFQGGGLASLREAAEALQRFRATGKPVVAWATSYSQAQYYLAAHADDVLLHPMGNLLLDGLGGENNYYAEALDRLGLKAHVVRTGSYKNMAEQFTANAPSPETLEAQAYVLDELWALITSEIETARDLPKGKIMELINALPAPLEAANGDIAQMSVDQGLITGLKDIQQVRADFIAAGAEDTEHHTFRQIAFKDYLSRIHQPTPSGDGVGIIVAEGEISDGVAPRGSIGGESTAARVRKARLDDTVKAIVLRVNSPGGAVLGSELIRRELALAREAGKPIVVSMGDVAASGGYWISTASDKIIAAPGTITGSIGVITVLPSAEGLMDKLAIHQGGYQTTWLKSAGDIRQPLNPRFEQLLTSHIQYTYQSFLGRVSEARNMTKEAVNEIAQGRIWTGKQAMDRGLVDELGNLQDAINSARTLAKLPEKAAARYIEPDNLGYSWLLQWLGAQLAATISNVLPSWMTETALTRDVANLHQDAKLLQHWLGPNTHFNTMAHCLCRVEW